MRFGLVFIGVGSIVGAIFGGVVTAYWAAGAAEKWGFQGASGLTNMVFLMLVFVMVIATLLTLAERKWSALMQDRVGPNRARLAIIPGLKNAELAGIPHIITDVLKMLTKEAFTPKGANSFLFKLGPMLAFAPVFALFAIVPAGPTIPVLGHQISMVVAAPDFGLLYLFAIASLAVYGTSLAGWASNNKFALLGSVRAASQMISYEVALGLSLVGMMIAFGTVQLAGPTGMAEMQAGYLWRFTPEGSFDVGIQKWGILLQPIGFVLFFAAAFAETKRAPFDVPEGESEIIGYFVEYSGMQFGLFMISEFVEVVVLSGVLAAIFFGGWSLPIGDEWLRMQFLDASGQFNSSTAWIYGSIMGTVFWIKVVALCYLQLAIRWTFPRFRYDQIQTLGWKILLPAGLFNVFLSGALILWDPSLRALAIAGALEIGLVIALTLTPRGRAEDPHSDAGHDHGHGGHAPGHAAAADAHAAAPAAH
jgi:NADH-quinone oxidoreductase subunit H